MKAFLDNNFNVASKGNFTFQTCTLWDKEKLYVCDQHFLPFPECFQRRFDWE